MCIRDRARVMLRTLPSSGGIILFLPGTFPSWGPYFIPVIDTTLVGTPKVAENLLIQLDLDPPCATIFAGCEL